MVPRNPTRRKNYRVKKTALTAGFSWNLCNRFLPLAIVSNCYPDMGRNFEMSTLNQDLEFPYFNVVKALNNAKILKCAD